MQRNRREWRSIMRWTNELLQAEQQRLEQAMFDGGVSRYEKAKQRAIESGDEATTAPALKLTKEFVQPLSEGIQAYIDHTRSRGRGRRSEEHTSELQSRPHLVCRL